MFERGGEGKGGPRTHSSRDLLSLPFLIHIHVGIQRLSTCLHKLEEEKEIHYSRDSFMQFRGLGVDVRGAGSAGLQWIMAESHW